MPASDIYVLPPLEASVSTGDDRNVSSSSLHTSPTLDYGTNLGHHFNEQDGTDVGDDADSPTDDKSKRWSSSAHGDPQAARTHELLEKILETLSLSTAAGRVDRSTRARFWDMYKAEAEEFHEDFVDKYNSELDISLIFAGLFCGVDATFLALMQPDLGPDPNQTTQALLMIIAQSLNNSQANGEQLIVLPSYRGPSTMTIWIQCLLYASLAASLSAALGAMLGKQWLGHYAHISERGTAEHRCIDRQRKLVGLETWHFHAVLECLPSLLQGSLFLFIIGLAAYLWNLQRTISAVLIAAAGITIMFYSFMIISSVLYDDCPFRTPVSDALLLGFRQASRCGKRIKKFIQESWKSSRSNNKHQSISMGLLPVTAQHSLSMAHGRAYELQQTATIMDMLMTQPRDQLNRSARGLQMATKRPTILEDSFLTPEQHLDLSASCVSWLLVTSTHPEVITTSARMVLEVSWNSSRIDPLPMLLQLRDAFSLCFVEKIGRFNLAPHCHDRALACGQAMLHVYFQRWCVQKSSENVLEYGTAEEVGQLLTETHSFRALWSSEITSASHPDLFFVIRTLQILGDHGPVFAPQETRRKNCHPPKSEALNEWFSHEMVQCLGSPRTPVRVKLYALDIFAALFTRGLHSLFRKTYAQCFLACAYGMGYIPQLGHMWLIDMSARPEEALGQMLSQLTRTVSLQLQANVSLDPVHITFAWELMEPLAHLCEFGSFREVLRSKNMHHLSILLCRKVLEEEVLKKKSISERQWPWIDSWIKISILSPSPSRHHEGQLYTNNVKLFKDDGFKRIWQCHYVAGDKDYLIPADYDWIVHVMRDARTSGPTLYTGSSKVFFPRAVVYCLTLLCEVPDISADLRCKKLYPDVAWALQAGGIFGQAALKLARAMCGPGLDVNVESLRSLINGTRPYINFSDSLALLCGAYIQSSDEFYGMPESYPFHMAYLDILVGLIDLASDDLPAILSVHIQNCMNIASLLRSNKHDWSESELRTMRMCLGRQVDDRPWKPSSPAMTIEVSDSYPNTFIRDIWWRLSRIVTKFHQISSSPSMAHSEDGILTNISLACASWQIYDTHPLPGDVLLAMSNLLWKVLDMKHDGVEEIDKQFEIQRTFRHVSHIIHDVDFHLSAQTRDIWQRARNILRDHIDISIETLEPPLTVHSLAYDGQNLKP